MQKSKLPSRSGEVGGGGLVSLDNLLVALSLSLCHLRSFEDAEEVERESRRRCVVVLCILNDFRRIEGHGSFSPHYDLAQGGESRQQGDGVGHLVHVERHVKEFAVRQGEARSAEGQEELAHPVGLHPLVGIGVDLHIPYGYAVLYVDHHGFALGCGAQGDGREQYDEDGSCHSHYVFYVVQKYRFVGRWARKLPLIKEI